MVRSGRERDRIRGSWLGAAALGCCIVGGAVSIGAGCQASSNTPADTSGSGASGQGGDASSTTSTSSQGGSSSTSSSNGGGSPCEGVDATIKDVTTGEVGLGVKVKLTGVIAMSQKFLVSKGSMSGSCLWGMFVSAPGLAETEPNSGILVLDYGFNATIPEGGTDAFCPKLGEDDIGDDLPDDVKPGDVLDFVGETADFLLSNCASEPNGSTVGQFQIAKTCGLTKTGTAAVPPSHVFTGAELEKLSSPDDKAFHDAWGGVRVRVEDVNAVPAEGGGAVGMYGVVTLQEGNLEVADKLYYRGYAKFDNFCHDNPVFDTTLAFTAIEGISYLDFCTWRIAPNDKCDDFEPGSEDCEGAVTCPP